MFFSTLLGFSPGPWNFGRSQLYDHPHFASASTKMTATVKNFCPEPGEHRLNESLGHDTTDNRRVRGGKS